MAKRKRSSSEIEEAKTAAMAVSSKSELRHREKERKKAKSGGFESMGLCLEVYRGVKRKGYNVPTPIQRKTIPLILSGADVVAMARTGSGKTAAFLVPLLQRLRRHLPEAGIRALVLSPTRDLALQTLRFARDLGRFTDLRTSLLVGGDSMEDQFADLSHSSPDIIIATPGRLMHHLSEIDDGGFSLRSVEYTVFDEADSLFEMGFADQLRSILSHLGDSRQTLLFSATMPSALADFAKAGLRDPHLVRLDVDTKISPDLTLAFFTMRHEEKSAALLYLVRERISSDQQTLVFVSTKHHVEFLNLLFREEGIEPSVSYGDMDQDARKIHVSKFRSRKTMILIVTDVAARGIDIPLLDNVVNWDFPPKPKIFVHRVGRAARAGRTGTAYSFLTPDEIPYLLDLHLFLSKPISPSPSEDQVLNDMENVLSKVDQAIARGETVYGRFPQATIDLVSERVREVIQDSAELIALQKACANAFRLYSKTKPLPSKDSINRAKDLSHEGLHPLFRDLLESNELTAIAFTEKLKSFRPRQTILEAEAEAAKSNNLQGPGQWLEVMKKKRAVHEKIINLVRQKHLDNRESKGSKMDVKASHAMKTIESLSLKTNAKSFVDEENYISSIPKNQHTEAGLAVKGNEVFGSSRLDSAVCDLVADDSSGMQKQQQIYHWDKRGKKYIKLNNGERVTASGKNHALCPLPFSLRHYSSSEGRPLHHQLRHYCCGWRFHRQGTEQLGRSPRRLQCRPRPRHLPQIVHLVHEAAPGSSLTSPAIVQIKTESGAKVKGEKTGIYKRWKEKTHNKISMTENSSKNNLDASIEGKEGVHGNRRNFKGGNKRWSIPNANVRDEIKNPDQIRKSRQMKATKIASFKSKSKKKFANKRKGGGKRKKS